MCAQYFWKTVLSEWYLSWKVIPLSEWQTLKTPFLASLYSRILWTIYPFSYFYRFRYPNWVIWVSQLAPKKVPFHSDFRTNMLIWFWHSLDFSINFLPTQVPSGLPHAGITGHSYLILLAPWFRAYFCVCRLLSSVLCVDCGTPCPYYMSRIKYNRC